MPSTLSAQLAALELGHLSIAGKPEVDPSLEAPDASAVTQTLGAVWSDLFALLTDTNLEPEAEELAWGFVNLFHRAATKKLSLIDRATDEIRLLVASSDGSEVHASELEQQIERAQGAEAAMIALEGLRETAAHLYRHETGHSWRPAGGSRLNHDANATSAVVQGREFLRARAETKRRTVMPTGTPVVFAGGRLQFPTAEQAKQFGDNVWATLDKVREPRGGDGPRPRRRQQRRRSLGVRMGRKTQGSADRVRP